MEPDTSPVLRLHEQHIYQTDKMAPPLTTAFAVFKNKFMFGKTVMEICREFFSVDKEGVVRRHNQKVKPAEHPDEVIVDVKGFGVEIEIN